MAENEQAPVISSRIDEVQAVFPSDTALQDALAKLTLAGCDRADFSLPQTAPPASEARPEAGADNPDTEVDNRQMRTMHSSMAGSIGAMAAAGAVVATGGAVAAAAVAAAAVGAGAGLAANAASTAADSMQHEDRERAAAEGRLVLAVRVGDPARRPMIERILRDAGATRVAAVTRTDNAISAASWTG